MIVVDSMVIFILLSYMCLLVGIGFYFNKKSINNDMASYILGGRSLGASATAISACASDMSGWIMLSLPGLAFSSYIGDYALVPLSLLFGFFVCWSTIAKRMRVYTYFASNSLTIPDFLENRLLDNKGLVKTISAFVTVFFFAIYIASGIYAFSSLIESLFDYDRTLSALIGTLVIIAYTVLGGFLAVSWTDFFQGILLLISLTLIPVIIFITKDIGVTELVEMQAAKASGHNQGFLNIIYQLGWGLAYFGQPHILSRFMAIKSTSVINKARSISLLWLLFALSGSVAVGLAGGIIVSDSDFSFKSEHVVIYLASLSSSSVVSGLLITAILSAVMSSVDSQILIASSTMTADVYKKWFRPNASGKELVYASKFFVILISLIAVLIALSDNSSIMGLVSTAWSGFGASFGPVIILSLYWRKYNMYGCLSSLLTGALSTIIFDVLVDAPSYASLTVPGFILALIAGVFVSLLFKTEKPLLDQFDKFKIEFKNK